MFFIFTDSCRYEYKNNQIKEQINKLGGFGSLRHHKNSKRIGWRYNQEQDNIELYSYNYTKGVRTIEYIKSVEFNKLEKVLLHTEKPFKSGKLLFPYFGGKAEATKNTSIFLGFLI